jgi:hypothetical protein
MDVIVERNFTSAGVLEVRFGLVRLLAQLGPTGWLYSLHICVSLAAATTW